MTVTTTSYPRFDGTQACAAEPTLVAVFTSHAAGESDTRAAAVCAGCGFLEHCRSYALTHDVHGIWGGLTDEDRKVSRVRAHLPEPRSITDELDDLVRSWRSRTDQQAGTDAAGEDRVSDQEGRPPRPSARARKPRR